MIAEGCIMLRACHQDTCKPGVATQRPHLRANFTGTPEGVAAYFCSSWPRRCASILAAWAPLARRGHRPGRAAGPADHRRRPRRLLRPRPSLLEPGHATSRGASSSASRCSTPAPTLGDRLRRRRAAELVWDGDEVRLRYAITNADRSVGAALWPVRSALEYGAAACRGHRRGRASTAPPGRASAPSSATAPTFTLVGEANDYVGKGMGGGEIVIRPPADDARRPPPAPGQHLLYGATGGELYVAGAVGERFARPQLRRHRRGRGRRRPLLRVHDRRHRRGDPGRLGHNLGAGMTGGQAFVFDPADVLPERYNPQLIALRRVQRHEQAKQLRTLLRQHAQLTSSPRAKAILDDWDVERGNFWLVLPKDAVAAIEAVNRGAEKVEK